MGISYYYNQINKNWLNFDDDSAVLNNEFFNILIDLDISFYNTDNQIKTKVKLERETEINFENFLDIGIKYNLITVQNQEAEEENDDNDDWY